MLTRPDAPAGRGRRMVRSPVGALADEAGLPVLTPRRPSDPEFLDTLRALAPDCCAIVAYGALVPRAALDVPRYGWVNLHFSLLPAWRGAAPVQAAVRHGDEITGAATFRLEEGLDTGPVYGVVTEAVAPTDTAGDLLGRLARSGAALLAATIDGIADGTLVPRPQPADGVSHAPKVAVADAQVDWAAPTAAVDRLVRSVTPDPGAWTTFRGERLGLGPVLPADPAGAVRAQARRAARREAAGAGRDGDGGGGAGRGPPRRAPPHAGCRLGARGAHHAGRGARMSELASESVSQRPRAVWADRAQRGSAMSELASESVSQRLRAAPTERSEGVR